MRVHGQVEFSIYGPIEDRDYWQRCQDCIQDLPSNVQVSYCGECARDDIEATYGAAHAMILPTLTENYGHSIVESMLAGCPVIISDQTPWTSVKEYGAGWALPLEDKGAFAEAVQHVVEMDSESYGLLLSNNKMFVQDFLVDSNLEDAYLGMFFSVADGRRYV